MFDRCGFEHDEDSNSVGIRRGAFGRGRTSNGGLEHDTHNMQLYDIWIGTTRNRAMSVANIPRSQRRTQHIHVAEDDYDSEDYVPDLVSVPDNDNESISGVDDWVDN